LEEKKYTAEFAFAGIGVGIFLLIIPLGLGIYCLFGRKVSCNKYIEVFPSIL
jgi:hypothetical protein